MAFFFFPTKNDDLYYWLPSYKSSPQEWLFKTCIVLAFEYNGELKL